MEVMTLHMFFDEAIEKVSWEGHADNRKIVFNRHDLGSVLINKEDAIALAKEFNLVVLEKDSLL